QASGGPLIAARQCSLRGRLPACGRTVLRPRRTGLRSCGRGGRGRRRQRLLRARRFPRRLGRRRAPAAALAPRFRHGAGTLTWSCTGRRRQVVRRARMAGTSELIDFRRAFVWLLCGMLLPSVALVAFGVVAVVNERVAVERRLETEYGAKLRVLNADVRARLELAAGSAATDALARTAG